MDWPLLLGSGAAGALLTKVLDVVWLQKVMEAAERKRWLREKRLKVYADLTAELLTLGRKSDLRNDAFEGYALCAEAILLTDNDSMATEIEEFFTWQANLFTEAARSEGDQNKKPEAELEGAYVLLHAKSRSLVTQLRRSLHSK